MAVVARGGGRLLPGDQRGQPTRDPASRPVI